ncbi:MAG: hypothetical protein ACE5D7_07515 [Fidelibacterota bacterium]
MIYSDLILNERNWGNLRSAIKNHRLHHALLFHGPSGVGKSAHAVELAAILNCLQPTTEGACGLCSSCIKVRTFQHENVKLILPFPRKTGLDKNSPSIKALSDVDLASLNEQMLEMGKNPYFKIVLENANTILINSIRDLKNELYLSVPGGGSRIVLIMDAELLCLPDPASANALLKILEEPPEKTYFILISSRADLLLETILSRCQKVFFPALSEKDIESYLTEEGESRSNAHLIANVSEGNMHLAQSFKGSVPQLYENAKTILNAVFTKQPDRWKKFHKEVNRMKKNSRVFFSNGDFCVQGFDDPGGNERFRPGGFFRQSTEISCCAG